MSDDLTGKDFDFRQEDVIATGLLHKFKVGVLQGGIEIPVRGEFTVMMERRDKVNSVWTADLTVHPFTSKAHLVRNPLSENTQSEYWHSYIHIEGYEYHAKIYCHNDQWKIELRDTRQRRPIKYRILERLNEQIKNEDANNRIHLRKQREEGQGSCQPETAGGSKGGPGG